MPLMITEDCIACGACEPVCPNKGIRKSGVVYVIDRDSCTECVGFFSKQQCVVVCPMDCCGPIPGVVLTEEALFERARAIHANSHLQPTLTEQTSHFRATANRNSQTTASRRKWWQWLFWREEGSEPCSSVPANVAESG